MHEEVYSSKFLRTRLDQELTWDLETPHVNSVQYCDGWIGYTEWPRKPIVPMEVPFWRVKLVILTVTALEYLTPEHKLFSVSAKYCRSLRSVRTCLSKICCSLVTIKVWQFLRKGKTCNSVTINKGFFGIFRILSIQVWQRAAMFCSKIYYKKALKQLFYEIICLFQVLVSVTTGLNIYHLDYKGPRQECKLYTFQIRNTSK